jgi:hypothetical protein
MSTPALFRRPEIGLAAAAYLQLGLEALRAGDEVRAIGAFASIDTCSWEAVLDRFPTLSDLISKWEAAR